jgi:hypothetical protein
MRMKSRRLQEDVERYGVDVAESNYKKRVAVAGAAAG